MTVHIIVEGHSDATFLNRLFQDQPGIGEIEYYIGGGQNYARPKARRIQLETREPVMLVMDADRTDLDAARNQLAEYQAYLERFSGGIPSHVLMFVPELEVVLFDLPRFVEQAEKKMPLEIARLAPGAALKTLGLPFPDKESVFSSLTDEEVELLKKRPELAFAIQFLEKAIETNEHPQAAK